MAQSSCPCLLGPAPWSSLPGERQERQRRHGEQRIIDGIPAEPGEQPSRQERCDGHGDENGEIIHRLNLAALSCPVAGRNHAGRPDEGEIPSKAQEDECGSEILEPYAEDRRTAANRENEQAEEAYALG